MAKLGLNVKFRVAEKDRARLKAVMLDAFGVTSKTSDRFEIFDLGGCNFGAEVVADSKAPSAATMKEQGAWLEIVVDDTAKARAELAKHGIEPFEYVDKKHDYVQLPGGLVVRIAGQA